MSGLWFVMFFGMLPLALYASVRAYDDVRRNR
jgi:hypothetical protein